MSDVLKDFNQINSLQVFKDITGIVLAGGKSLRYGSNKALAKKDGVPLIELVINRIKNIFQDLVIITNTPELYAYLNYPMYEDFIKGLGPLAGIHTALSNIDNGAGFFVGCDMPFLNRGLIRYMCENRGSNDVVVPRISSHIETLHAIYSKKCLLPIKKLIDSQEYQVRRFFSEVNVLYIKEKEVKLFDPELKSFININRPQDWRRLRN